MEDEKSDSRDISKEMKSDKTSQIADKDMIVLTDSNVIVNVEDIGRSTPFVPYKERNLVYNASMRFSDLPLPPLMGADSADLTNLVSAKVTGILYDINSPSAIINVLDQDYLVKKGDKIEQFTIADIKKDYVAIQTGSNSFRTRVGEIVEGDVNPTGVYNLGRRFAGVKHPARPEDIIIVKAVKKKDQKDTNILKDFSLPDTPSKNSLPTIDLKNLGDLPAPPKID
ncbi:MAG: hypothetical protein PHX18_06500 [Candidatus Gastranaerophilales bacterium]|nr:hypothetical protein [Candidatus Gastranaerophilales bacterium]